MKTMQLVISGGNIRHIYDDSLCAIADEGVAKIKRASHVEPCGNKWYANLGPIGGPVLGPFSKRSEALEAETQWLLDHNIPIGK